MRQTSHSLTIKATGRARALVTTISVIPPDVFDIKYDTRAIWDTGASGTVITQKVVDALGLQPTGFTKVNTASQRNVDSPTFLVDVILQNGVRITNVNVT
jgi:predicted aspartyl protease